MHRRGYCGVMLERIITSIPCEFAQPFCSTNSIHVLRDIAKQIPGRLPYRLLARRSSTSSKPRHIDRIPHQSIHSISIWSQIKFHTESNTKKTRPPHTHSAKASQSPRRGKYTTIQTLKNLTKLNRQLGTRSEHGGTPRRSGGETRGPRAGHQGAAKRGMWRRVRCCDDLFLHPSERADAAESMLRSVSSDVCYLHAYKDACIPK